MDSIDERLRRVPKTLPQLDQDILWRHIVNAENYERNPAEAWPVEFVSCQDAEITARALKEANILGKSSSKRSSVLVSPSSHVGVYERALQSVFGDEFTVVAGDITRVHHLKGLNSMVFDASFLPFANQSVSVIFDRAGALWYELNGNGWFNSEPVFSDRLLHEYRRVLNYGGQLIFDQNVSTNTSTDLYMGHHYRHQTPQGFIDNGSFGSGSNVYRVLQKTDD